MTVDLDTRLRSAGDSLVRASERLSPAGPPRSLRPVAVRLAGVIAAVALVAGAVTAAVVSGGGDGPASDTATGAAAPRLVVDAVPDGLRPAGVVELSSDGTLPGVESVAVYGDAGADDPFAESDLGILTAGFPFIPDEGGETVTVRGHEAVVGSPLPTATGIMWEEAEGFTVALASSTLDVDDLVAIAEGLAVDAEARTAEIGTLPDDLPGPLAPVAAADLATVLVGLQGFGLPADEATSGHVATFRPDAYGDLRGAAVATFTGDAGDLAVVRWLGGADTPTDVRGRPGWSGSHELPGFDDGEGIVPGSQGPLSTVVWEESPGVLAVVQTFGPSGEDARAMAESLRPATGDEWDRLVRLGASGDRFAPLDDERAGSDGSDAGRVEAPDDAVNGAEGAYRGGAWTTWLLPDGTLCGAVAGVDDADANVSVRHGADAAETCDPEGGPATVVRDGAGEPVLVIGVMAEGAVGRIPVGGDVEEMQTVSGPADAPAYYVMVLGDGGVPTAVTFVAADGTDLETVPVDP